MKRCGLGSQGQLLGEFQRHKSRPAGRNLARLDVGGTEFLKSPPESLGLGQGTDRTAFCAKLAGGQPQQARQVQALREVLIAILQEDRDDLTGPSEVVDRLPSARSRWAGTPEGWLNGR